MCCPTRLAFDYSFTVDVRGLPSEVAAPLDNDLAHLLTERNVNSGIRDKFGDTLLAPMTEMHAELNASGSPKVAT